MKIDLKEKPFYLNENQIRWVNDTLSSMSEDEKIGQLFSFVTYTDDEKVLEQFATKYKAGGVMCRPMQIDKLVNTISLLQKNSRIPMLISANLEVGASGVCEEGTKVGCQMSVAAGPGPDGAATLGDICGKEGSALGINWAFAPVSDIDMNFRNPITNTRTYGSDPDMVRKCVTNYIQACQRHGVAATAKHFPGDGCDERDQHLETSINDLSCEEWDRTYGTIYRSAIDAGVLTVMTGHIMQPAWSRKLNPEINDKDIMPGSLSKELLNGLLRERLGFNGVIVTDATTMAGFSIPMPREKAVPYSIAAGCDMFLFTKNLEEDLGFMKQGLENGILSHERVDEAVTRILAMKAALKLNEKNNVPDKQQAQKIIEENSKLGILSKTADESITLVKNNAGILPISLDKHKRILFFPIDGAAGKVTMYGTSESANVKLISILKENGFEVTAFQPKPGLEGLMDSAKELEEKYDLLIYCANLATKSNQTTVRIEWQQPMGINVPVYMTGIPTVFISLENPYHLLDAPRVPVYINCYQSDEEVLRALVDKLMGRSEFKGKSPVDAFCGKWDTRL